MSPIEAGLDINQPGGRGLYGSYSDPASYYGDNVTEAINNSTEGVLQCSWGDMLDKMGGKCD